MKINIRLYRVYLNKATHGLLQINGRSICLTIELPWAANQRSISCIPEGRYILKNRFSPRFKEHIEVLNVPDRSFILFHPANNAMRDLRGCIAPVSEIANEGWGVNSRIAMSKLLNKLKANLPSGNVTLTVLEATDEKIVKIIKKGKL
ncbi:DUF5675 family protein [Myroides phaeus]|uniref:DUF5675 domain-containing protein n=1 Tax=Myroides phaeus TaxID=702745 RepID=A0A1G8CJP0_9FLAO|nr:DUF5675 family protein [Myroides phaeus]MEC4116378.1 DUF5675 family protein [Myroides phaeus]SDH45708.1 hypothetical protein SAMN05421818_10485 [Myroides phaeus]